MKKQTLFWGGIFSLLTACGPSEKPAAPVPETPQPTAKPAAPKAKFPVSCYELHMPDGSVFSLHFTEYYDDIVGLLDYSFAEKDGAHGTFRGKKNGNVVTAVWDFTVEGSEESEEIVFKIEGDKAVKASGELMPTKAGYLKIKDLSKASWNETFNRVDCD